MLASSNKDKLPSGLPDRWPNHDEEDLKQMPWRLINVGNEQKYYYRDNFVKTSKYTFYLLVWDFLPKFLLEEFNPKTKIANCYFFIIALLQIVPQISNTGGLPTTFAPLAVVVFVDGLFQVLEDLMGDYVKVHSREQIPADLLVLCQLDGETNLKLRLAMPNTMANIQVCQPVNVLLRGCVLRNTDWSSNMEHLVSADSIWYLGGNVIEEGPGTNWIIMFFYYFLLHATFIPVSLYVSMTLARALQSYFMMKDEEMYYDAIDAPAQVRTMTLNEELGQISHIFSDKTGTLTCNVMDFRKFSANGKVYGQGITEIGKASWRLQGKEVPASVLEGEARSKENSVPHAQGSSNPEYAKVQTFFRTLAICHDVIAERVDGTVKLSASNPDDEALVCAAEYFGFKFCDLKEADGTIRLYIKGADTVINERLRKGQASLKKKLQPNLIEQLEEEIEKDIILIECIALLAKAGIKIWVLTGDKEETAINIAVACNLVLPEQYMEHIIINNKTAPTREAMIELFDRETARYESDMKKVGETCLPRALIIDGPSLTLATANKAINKLLQFSQRCKAVVGCRVSPDQKREMVDMIKTGVKGIRSLAIGDGANDVAMIQEAHIGVGIKGEEGLQAVNASDYAIAQFRFLASLLLKHGRYNYIRMAALVCYMFYKNIFMSMGQFWFNFNNAWSGQKYYNEMTAYDKDITATSCKLFPQDYQECVKNIHFSSKRFWIWLVTAVLESVIVSVIPLYVLQSTGPDGSAYSFWAAGTMCYTCVVVVCNIKLLFVQNLTSIAYSSLPKLGSILYTYTGVATQLLGNGAYWGGWILICTLIIGKDIYFCALERTFNYNNYHIIQEYEKEHDYAGREILEAQQRKDMNKEKDSGKDGGSSGISVKSVAPSVAPSSPGNDNLRSPRAVGSSLEMG
eukprot:GSChrysophyteH1.ASY1.ANO1.1126.1 assembled CDS